MIKIGDEIELDVMSTGQNGEGVAKLDNQVVFVDGALIGEKVLAKITSTKSKFATAKTIKVLVASPQRVLPSCPYFGKCGGCNLQHMCYAAQLVFKQEKVANNLRKIAKAEPKVEQTIGSSNQYFYRNKVSFPVGKNGISMICQNSHSRVKIEKCLVANQGANELISIFDQYLKQSGDCGFDFEIFDGNIRHVVARFVGDEVLVCVVCKSGKIKDEKLLISLLQQKFSKFGLFTNKNEQKTSQIFGNQFVHLYGIEHISANMDEISYPISVASFVQVNDDISAKIYKEVAAQIDGNVVVNAYSGTGLLSAMLAKSARQVIAIELDPFAHKNAECLKTENKIANLKNICGKVEEQLGKVEHFDAIVLDPPRSGCDQNVLDIINKIGPQKIVYVSCASSILARDISRLLGYKIAKVVPWDMFPQTSHVETMVVLEKAKTKGM